uniref:G-protein coupled receptor family C group 6 member A n=1 Tax=Seriola dumerili TaxID=41447 RepID=A0A3B4TJE4_SERDU
MTWTALIICSHLTLLLMILETGHTTDNNTRGLAATAPGDIIIGGIFPVHTTLYCLSCRLRFKKKALDMVLAMINAIEVMNKSPLLTEVNVTLGYRILDSCADVSTTLRATADFMGREGSNTSTSRQPIMAVIGPSHSGTTIAMARQLTLRMIPQVRGRTSFSATAVTLSDKTRYPAFMRTVPNDKHQTAAMVRLIKTYDWNWVGIITSDGEYGRSALELFVTQALKNKICVAFSSVLPNPENSPDFKNDIKQAARAIRTNINAKVIVSFARTDQMTLLYQELKDQTLREGKEVDSMRRVWLASDSWSSSSSVTGNLTLKDIGDVVGFTFKNGNVSSLIEYLNRLEAAGHQHTGNNSFLQEFYQQLNNSNFSTDTELVSEAVRVLKKEINNDTVFSLEMALSAIAHAVASVCRSRDCKTPGSVQPWEVLEALKKQGFKYGGKSYNFNEEGDLLLGYDMNLWRSDGREIHINEVVAEYDLLTNNFTYTNHSTTQQLMKLKDIKSKCSNSCVPGEIKKTAEGQHTCCYECINCTANHYSNETDMDQCLRCDTETEWSSERSSVCTPKTLTYFSWDDSFAVALVTFTALGIVLVLMVSALFLHQRDTPVVKAAGGPLSQVVLFSLIVSYISAMLFVGQPNSPQCKARQVLFGISFTLCVSCILVKTLKILLAFQFNPELQEVLRRFYRPYVIVSIIVALQIVICVCWMVLDGPVEMIISNSNSNIRLEQCAEGSVVAFWMMLGYIAILAFVCFVCAFKVRRLPQDYNEARFITFSMLLYLISWLIFIPVYKTSPGKYQSAVEMVIILISNYGILSCHFFPKCYIILFKKEKNTKSAFRKNLYEYSNKTSDCVSVSGCSGSEFQSSSQLVTISALSLSVSADHPLKPAVVTDSRDTNTPVHPCRRRHKGSDTGHCLRRSISIIT